MLVWLPGQHVTTGDVVDYEGTQYRVLTDHVTSSEETPETSDRYTPVI